MAAARRRGYGPTVPTAPPRNDAYTGLLVLALVAMLIAAGFLVAEIWGQYGWELKARSTPAAGVGPGVPR